MPYGRTVITWAVCDKCKQCIENDSEYGSKRDAADFARLNGWTVSRDGTCLCWRCKCNEAMGVEPPKEG